MNMKWLGGVGGALLLAAGVAGFIFARRRHRASRRDQAMQTARESAKLAAAAAGSLRDSDMGRRLMHALPDRDSMESTMEQNAKRARHMAGHAAKRARKKIGR